MSNSERGLSGNPINKCGYEECGRKIEERFWDIIVISRQNNDRFVSMYCCNEHLLMERGKYMKPLLRKWLDGEED